MREVIKYFLMSATIMIKVSIKQNRFFRHISMRTQTNDKKTLASEGFKWSRKDRFSLELKYPSYPCTQINDLSSYPDVCISSFDFHRRCTTRTTRERHESDTLTTEIVFAGNVPVAAVPAVAVTPSSVVNVVE